MKAYISKYALTKGIFEVEAAKIRDNEIVVDIGIVSSEFFHANEWHTTRAEAINRAEEMRLKKIESLKKQIAKLEKKRFE